MDQPAKTSADAELQEVGGGLSSTSFIGLLTTQFLGATNDNILRWLVIGIGKQYVDAGIAQMDIGTILGAGTACFVLPYLILAAPAGFLADRYSKRQVIVACKAAEVVIMLLAVAAIFTQNIVFLFGVVALMGSQSALFGPSKLGSIPEMLAAEKISSANGLVGLTTVAATAVGMGLGNWLTDHTGAFGLERLWLSAVVLVGVAGVGWFTSLWIAHLKPANPARCFPFDAVSQTWRDLQTLAQSRAMLRVALGIMFFWSLGALAQMNIDQFAKEGGAAAQSQITPLLVALVCGVGLGSVLAGLWSSGKVELGILPLGAGGLALSSILLFTVEGIIIEPQTTWTAGYVTACFFLFLLGLSAGLFDVPLAAYMQHRSPPESRGAILAASNFMTFTGMLVAAGAFTLLRTEIHGGEPFCSARTIFLLCGLATLPVFIYIVCLIPQASIRFLVFLATHTVYKVNLHGRENLPETGGALLVANHVSWVDGVLLLATSSRPIRILIDADWVQGGWARWLARTMGAIPVKPTPKATRAAIEDARRALENEELVCIFPEGSMTRTGELQQFKRGMMEIIRDSDVAIVPVYLAELWGSIFSYRGGRFWWKWPRHWASQVSIWFGRPLTQPRDVAEVRRAVQELGFQAVQYSKSKTVRLARGMIGKCRRALFRRKVSDSSGVELTGGALLLRTLILRRLLLREVLFNKDDEPYVGVLLPPTVAGVVTNAAIAMCGRASVNLNYTVSSDVMNACLDRANIRHVLTSRKVMGKLDLDIDVDLVYLEEFKDRATLADKLISALLTYLVPARIIERLFGLHNTRSDDVLTVIFTSGSTGVPKGVMLTHGNVASNVEAIDEVVHLTSRDTLLGILPFFHSFGYTVTLWTVLGLNVRGAYHFTPLDPKQVGKLCRKYEATVLLATPTFLRSYCKRCAPEDLASLDVVVVGAEKMPLALAEDFERRFGARPVEGYGTTELSPLVSVNVPPTRSRSSEEDCREGTVGRPVPGVSVKVVDPESFEELAFDTPGMLLVKGPNVMKGYLGQPDKTAEVIRDGWYVTGDIATVDDEGFIRITGRISRFSKIGGEMVPHVRVEEALSDVLGGSHPSEVLSEADDGDVAIRAAVTSVPDERKGERLVVLYTRLEKTPEEICRQMSLAGLPNLWIPSPDSFVQVNEIPVLGSGKLDLKSVQLLATEAIEAKK